MEFLDSIRLDVLWNYRELFIRGLGVTIMLTIVGYVCGIILGLIFGLGKMSTRKLFYYPSKLYIDFFRGTPLLVQILLIHIAVIPTIFGKSLGFFVSGALARSEERRVGKERRSTDEREHEREDDRGEDAR